MRTNNLLDEINKNTLYSKKELKSFIETANLVKEDLDKENRLKSNKCTWCYYINNRKIAGRAITSWKCEGCESIFDASSTATPKFCFDCSVKYHVCVQCGSDKDLQTNRAKL